MYKVIGINKLTKNVNYFDSSDSTLFADGKRTTITVSSTEKALRGIPEKSTQPAPYKQSTLSSLSNTHLSTNNVFGTEYQCTTCQKLQWHTVK